MSALAPVEHAGLVSVDGPLVVVRAVHDVGWDDEARVMLPDGSVRTGVVLEVDHDLAVVQVYQGTSGVGLADTRVAFTGHPLEIPVCVGWLGRTANGRGAPVDGGPPVTSTQHRPVTGRPVNPARRDVPRDPILTGISAIDALTTLVRGQKLPVFSVGGLPHLELACQIAAQARAGDEHFRVVFVGMGITHAGADLVQEILEPRAAAGDLALFLNLADDPPIECILTPRVALTVAEHLAFDLGLHVLVVLTDMTSYCDAVRQLSAARGDIPGRRGYPSYLFTDLASIYERCGRIRGRPGSITEVPVLTMPAGDISHPVPDLTGYITEGQIVLSPDVHARGVYPPVDPLSSLSRLMRRGAGPGRTRDDHLDVAAQLTGLLAEARRAAELAELIGADALSVTERRYLDYGTQLEEVLLHQEPDEDRTLDETFDRAWRVLSVLPRRELTLIDPAHLARNHGVAPTGHPGTRLPAGTHGRADT